MKKAMHLVLLLFSYSSVFSQNLVSNNSFESWETDSKPLGWTTSQNCTKETVTYHQGLYSCKHQGGTSAKYLGQVIPVSAGVRYKLSFYYKTETSGSGNGCRTWCYWRDNNGNNITDPGTDDLLRPSQYLKSDTWQIVSLEIIAPANASFLYLEVRTYPNSIAFWDEFILEQSIPTADIKPGINEESITVFPNPADNYISIRSLNHIRKIEICTVSGIRMLSEDFFTEGLIEIPVSGLKDGLYIIRLYTSEGIFCRKFLKNGN